MKSGGLKAFLPIGAFIGLVVIFYVGLFKDPTLVSSPLIGKAAPAFDLPSLHAPDQRISNADLTSFQLGQYCQTFFFRGATHLRGAGLIDIGSKYV